LGTFRFPCKKGWIDPGSDQPDCIGPSLWKGIDDELGVNVTEAVWGSERNHALSLDWYKESVFAGEGGKVTSWNIGLNTVFLGEGKKKFRGKGWGEGGGSNQVQTREKGGKSGKEGGKKQASG